MLEKGTNIQMDKNLHLEPACLFMSFSLHHVPSLLAPLPFLLA